MGSLSFIPLSISSLSPFERPTYNKKWNPMQMQQKTSQRVESWPWHTEKEILKKTTNRWTTHKSQAAYNSFC